MGNYFYLLFFEEESSTSLEKALRNVLIASASPCASSGIFLVPNNKTITTAIIIISFIPILGICIQCILARIIKQQRCPQSKITEK